MISSSTGPSGGEAQAADVCGLHPPEHHLLDDHRLRELLFPRHDRPRRPRAGRLRREVAVLGPLLVLGAGVLVGQAEVVAQLVGNRLAPYTVFLSSRASQSSGIENIWMVRMTGTLMLPMLNRATSKLS